MALTPQGVVIFFYRNTNVMSSTASTFLPLPRPLPLPLPLPRPLPATPFFLLLAGDLTPALPASSPPCKKRPVLLQCPEHM